MKNCMYINRKRVTDHVTVLPAMLSFSFIEFLMLCLSFLLGLNGNFCVSLVVLLYVMDLCVRLLTFTSNLTFGNFFAIINFP
jgi:hypothetical protein